MGWRTGEATSVKRMQSGSSSRSGRNWGAAAEAHAIGELQVKPEQQLNLRWTQSRSNSQSGRNQGAVETDAIGE